MKGDPFETIYPDPLSDGNQFLPVFELVPICYHNVPSLCFLADFKENRFRIDAR